MKRMIGSLALLLSLLLSLAFVACGGDAMENTTNKPTTPAVTTPSSSTPDTTSGGDPMMPGITTPADTGMNTDPLLPSDSTPAEGMDTTPAQSGEMRDPAGALDRAIRHFREQPTVRLGRITSSAVVDQTENESITTFRFERNGNDFYARTDSGADNSDVTVVGDTVYVRIGDILREKTTFSAGQYDTVLYSATLSVLDALELSSFASVTGTQEADGGARIVCHGIVPREAEKLEAVLNTVNMDMSEITESVECVFLLDPEGRIVEERCEVSTTVGHAVRATDDHTVALCLTVEATCDYPEEITIRPPEDAESYKQVRFEELFA